MGGKTYGRSAGESRAWRGYHLAAEFIRNLDAWDSETRACEHGSQEDLAELHFWWGFLIWKWKVVSFVEAVRVRAS